MGIGWPGLRIKIERRRRMGLGSDSKVESELGSKSTNVRNSVAA